MFVNVYAPNTRPERVLFLQKLEDVLRKCDPEEFLFVAGDFNCTENDEFI